MTRFDVMPGLIISMTDAAELMTKYSDSAKKEHKAWSLKISRMIDSMTKASTCMKQQEDFILFIKKNNEACLRKISELTAELEEYKQSERL